LSNRQGQCPDVYVNLCQRQVDSRFAAIAACFDVKRHGLTVIQLADACTL
jgi:hypothetical protein